MKYRADIDGLRSLAIIPVVAFHAGISAVSGGFTGVDVFFVISGYLITGIILAEIARQRLLDSELLQAPGATHPSGAVGGGGGSGAGELRLHAAERVPGNRTQHRRNRSLRL